MRLFTAALIAGVVIVGNSYADDQDQRDQRDRRDQHGGQHQSVQVQRNQSVVAPQVQRNQPVVVPSVVRESHQPVVQPVQEFRQSARPQSTEFPRAEVTRVRDRREPVAQQFQRTVQPTITRSTQQYHRDFSTVDRERRGTTSARRGSRYDQGNNNYYYYGGYGGVSTFYPFYGYPYLSVPYGAYSSSAYPNRFFICYVVDQSDEDSVHVSCPYRTGWYSTSPEYDTYQYHSAYRPEYVCPEYGADQFIEFSTSYEANDWGNQNCDQWIDNTDSEY